MVLPFLLWHTHQECDNNWCVILRLEQHVQEIEMTGRPVLLFRHGAQWKKGQDQRPAGHYQTLSTAAAPRGGAGGAGEPQVGQRTTAHSNTPLGSLFCLYVLRPPCLSISLSRKTATRMLKLVRGPSAKSNWAVCVSVSVCVLLVSLCTIVCLYSNMNHLYTISPFTTQWNYKHFSPGNRPTLTTSWKMSVCVCVMILDYFCHP